MFKNLTVQQHVGRSFKNIKLHIVDSLVCEEKSEGTITGFLDIWNSTYGRWNKMKEKIGWHYKGINSTMSMLCTL